MADAGFSDVRSPGPTTCDGQPRHERALHWSSGCRVDTTGDLKRTVTDHRWVQTKDLLRRSSLHLFTGKELGMSVNREAPESPTATYVLIHGAADVGWYWHLVERELRRRSHDVVVMDLPAADDSAGLSTYTDVVIQAIGDRDNLVLVAQSFGGYVAPIVANCDGRRDAQRAASAGRRSKVSVDRRHGDRRHSRR
jgi:pimeloyl-ACP methyl ester carboxylesterase